MMTLKFNQSTLMNKIIQITYIDILARRERERKRNERICTVEVMV